ncbi:hypothetical protein DH2020_049999 [Rehmannia glutinosa]|uniref:RING-type E3 ubiquitin transferase n=1 Tax=Rehmannia glutinosa TaxID=99300 RepID=A0ABR0U184_REHGL
MQGHRSSVTTLPENLSFDHGSTSSEAGIDSQMSWNTIQTSTHNRLPDYRISSNDTNMQYLHPVVHEGLNGEWSLGETSSAAAHSQEPQYEPSDILSSDTVDVNANGNQMQISGPEALPQDLNMRSEFDDHDDDTCQIVERPNTYISIGSSNGQMPSGNGGYLMEESEDRPGCSLDGRRVSCKRKSLEIHAGQSSGSGSSNFFQHAERNQWHALPAAQISDGNISMSTPIENNMVINNGSDPANPRLRLGVSANPFSSTARGTPETSRRNFRLRINGSRQQDHIPSNPFSPEADVANADVSSSQHSNPQSRWSGASSPRTNTSAISGERDPMLYEESMSRNIPRSISEHPMFLPTGEIGSSSQQPTNWNMGGNNIAGNVASTSRAGSGVESGGQSSNQVARSSSSQGMGLSSGSGNHGRHVSNSRSALSERQHIDGAFGLPHSLRSLAAASEGRSSIMSEIRHVLDLMRRGEGLRFEDVMILDHSVLFGMADMHDRHRDMRLDVDNMSYEELLALEERIGNVCTGLNEETIMSRLKQQKYIKRGAENHADTEPCSICREEYNDGEDLGTLECGHDFHRDCIKQWLMQKNLCPICKTTGLTT